MTEPEILLWIHRHASPFLDGAFAVSHVLGSLQFCVLLVSAALAWHLVRGQRRHAIAWLLLGLATYALQLSMKSAVARPRPDLWARMELVPTLVEDDSFAFPSGHALASAAFFPFLAWGFLRRRPAVLVLVGAGLPLFVGTGRLYLGVHWPTDVLAGWALGAVLSTSAVAWVKGGGGPDPAQA